MLQEAAGKLWEVGPNPEVSSWIVTGITSKHSKMRTNNTSVEAPTFLNKRFLNTPTERTATGKRVHLF